MLTMSTVNPVSDERAIRQLPTLPKAKSAGSGGSGSGNSLSPTRDFKQIDIPNLPPLVPRDADELSARRVQARPTKVHTSPNMHAKSRFEDNRPKEFNTEPLPYQPQYFKSSTMLKKVSIPKRHQDTFGGKEVAMTRQKEVIIHTERYQRESPMFGIGKWDVESDKNPPVQPPLPILSYVQTPNLQVTKNTYNFNKIRQQYNLNRESQRERHQAEKDYVESMRGLKRKREVLPHRAPLDLLMGGKRAEFNERESITDELNRLKSIVLPANARDLYHGRGIKLPAQHASVSPRRPMPPDEAMITTSAPATLVRVPVSHQPSKLSRKSNTFISQKPKKKTLAVIPPIKRQATVPEARPEFKPDPQPPVIAKKEETVVMREPSPPSSPSPVAEYNPILGVLDPSRHSSSIAPRTPRVPVHSDDDDLHDHDHNRGPSRTLPRPSLEVQQTDEDKMEVDPPPEDTTGQKTPESGPAAHKSTTPNPLKGVDLTSAVPQDQREELEVVFKNLDTDNDGHLKYNEVTKVLPQGLSNAQQRYIKQVYDITSASTFFGVDEFVTLSCLCQKMATLSGAAQDSYEGLDFATLQTSVLQFVELFQSVDRNEKGKVSIESLEEILVTLLEKNKVDNVELFQEIKQVVDPNDEDSITKIDYIAYIPYFLSLKQKS
ncbi:uncharacterized protein LOC106178443 isoform X1 [Lingula anatina]|uniref:Uncharacterized protein LOC106178443 isoform X1 n=1 Tax=Lingula anatina TaxID=7574 RepID=A0A1S3K375_LINAN|nr:uncharacterized protein LOC106178443 isoform X1 [Lingula anatina]|eukprot:XP_013417078.1 uncharacterized protein LOC106178443 isoform X1 [Lingula anatina]